MKKAAPEGGFFVNGQRPVEAGCLASGFERFCPLGGRGGLAFGKPLRRWGQGITAAIRGFQPGDPSMKTVVPPPSDPDAVGARPRHAHPGHRFSPFKKDLDKNPGPFLWPLTVGPRPARLRQVFISSVPPRDGSLNRYRFGRLHPGTPEVLSFRSAGRGTGRDGRWSHPRPSPPFPCRCRR